MSGYSCSTCGQTWPSNYCPTCRATIDRGALATVAAAPQAAASAAAAVAPRPPGVEWRAGTSGDTASGERVPFEFTGSGGEYFRIWIVNVALTVVTLGIYAAWAKVRKRQYFWSNVQLGGRSFEYTGNPIAILKGNLIFGAFAVAYYGAAQIEYRLSYVAVAGFWLVYPWLYHKAMRFNAWNTRHRNIRFGFSGTVGESYAINLGLGLLVPLTVGILWPYVLWRRRRYQLENLCFGTARFRTSFVVGPFYEYAAKALGLLLVGVVGGITLGGVIGAGGHDLLTAGVIAGVALAYLTGAAVFGAYLPTRLTNVVLAHSEVQGVASFHSSLSAWEVLKLELVNLLAIACTLGLATPWTTVRRAQYRWSHLEARFSGPIESVTAAAASAPGAVGDAMAEQLDIDISF